jgi:glucokinase
MGVMSLDLGGTQLKAGLVDRDGHTLQVLRRPSRREQGPDAVIAGLLETVDELPGAQAVGLVLPGILDEEAGMVRFAANFGFRDVPLRALVAERTGLPVAFSHDVRAGALAERWLGAARGAGDFLFLALGTGISAAAVLDGKPYAGGGYAGEIGHLVVDPGGRRCDCGARGCLETIASARAVADRYGAPAEEVARLAVAGDAVAGAVWAEAIDALAGALAMYVSILAPELIVIGGGLAEAGAALLEPLDAALAARLTFQRRPVIRRAALGDQAGRLGAALLAWEALG